MALIAAGDGDLTISFRPKNIWDVCAGTLLVREAGGKVTDFVGQDLDFTGLGIPIKGIVAANGDLHSQALGWLRREAKLPPKFQ
jgi:fructose-1,6-bisphosphatase/inositol monophosphatase family enzyme